MRISDSCALRSGWYLADWPVAKLSRGSGVRGVVGHEHAAFAHGPEILAEMKTEASYIAVTAHPPALVFGINHLRGVLMTCRQMEGAGPPVHRARRPGASER